VYGTLIGLAWGFMAYQPMAFDITPRPAPKASPKIDPDAQRLFAKGTRVVVVTAHPDDSEYYIGGTLLKLQQAGAEVSQVVLTDGDKGYYPWEDAAKNRKIRRAEQLEASRTWGAQELHFLGFPDGRLQTSEEVVAKLAQTLQKLRPEYVLAFDDEYPPRVSHQDHRRSGTVARAAVQKVPTVRWTLLFNTRAVDFAIDVSEVWEKRKELLAIHRSQFQGEKLQGVQYAIEEAAMNDAEKSEGTYAEGYRALRVER